MNKQNRCPECDCAIGEIHLANCDQEDCPYCGLQLIGCEHGEIGDGPPLDDVMPWDGMRAIDHAAIELGWYAIYTRNKGWVSCKPDTPGATLDLNRVIGECIWDRENKKFIKRQ